MTLAELDGAVEQNANRRGDWPQAAKSREPEENSLRSAKPSVDLVSLGEPRGCELSNTMILRRALNHGRHQPRTQIAIGKANGGTSQVHLLTPAASGKSLFSGDGLGYVCCA
jgi:hypothetical protein